MIVTGPNTYRDPQISSMQHRVMVPNFAGHFYHNEEPTKLALVIFHRPIRLAFDE